MYLDNAVLTGIKKQIADLRAELKGNILKQEQRTGETHKRSCMERKQKKLLDSIVHSFHNRDRCIYIIAHIVLQIKFSAESSGYSLSVFYSFLFRK